MKSVIALNLGLLLSSMAYAVELDVACAYKVNSHQGKYKRNQYFSDNVSIASGEHETLKLFGSAKLVLKATEKNETILIEAQFYDKEELVCAPVLVAEWDVLATVEIEDKNNVDEFKNRFFLLGVTASKE